MIKARTSLALLAPLITFVVVAILLLNPMLASQISPETQSKIDSICRSNEDYGFCNKVFQRDLPQPDMDYVGLTKITIVEALMNASNTLDFIRSQIPVLEDPQQLKHYEVCKGTYSLLKQRFEHAFDAFNKGEYKEMACVERDTPRIQASCVTIFPTFSMSEFPLNERNREMRILITMAVITATYIVT